jgi:hypothetical protein
MARLQDLDVDRIDVVGKPATRKRFLLTKNEEGQVTTAAPTAEPVANDAAAPAPAAPPPVPQPEVQKSTLVEKFMSLVQSLDGVAMSTEQEALISEILAEMERAGEAKSEDAPKLDELTDVIAEKVALALSQGGVPAAIAKAHQTRSQRIMASRQRPVQQPERIQRAAGPRKMGDGLFASALLGESFR